MIEPMNVPAIEQVRGWRPPRAHVAFWAVVVLLEGWLIYLYVITAGASLQPFHLYPFVWINLGVAAVWYTEPPAGGDRQRMLAGLVAAGYFLLLGYVGGLFGTGSSELEAYASGATLALSVPPGYGPALLYSDALITLALSPYMVVGYVALAYLVYVTVLDAAGAAVSGVLGLLTCVGCSWPILASIATGITGGTGALAATVYAQSYEISTVAFVLTVALLYWRPFHRSGS